MNTVICGGGKLGTNVGRAMLAKKNDVMVIEIDNLKAKKLSTELNTKILPGDCTRIETLESAGTMGCDCFMALTGSDQANLVASQLARNYFKAKKVISRVNDPRNIETFKALGIELTVSSTEIITNLIEQEASIASSRLVASLGKGQAEIISAILPEKSVLDGKRLKEIRFPKGVLIVSLTHGEEVIIPNGDTILNIGDEIVAVCTGKTVKEFNKKVYERRK
ncbi:MAG: NAD-binding protein [Clostridia bacterium]|nr:NAD-binding protein [Clostridia bacterium]